MNIADISFEQWMLLKIPSFWLNLICLGGPVVLSVIGLLVVRRLVPGNTLKEHHDVASAMFGIVGVVYGIFLAFVVATNWQQYETTATNISSEATQLGILYENAGAYTPDFRVPVQKELRDYRDAIVNREWKSLAEKGEPSPEAERLLNQITHHFEGYQVHSLTESAFFNESVRNLDMMKQLRQSRIDDATSTLEPFLWFVLLTGAALTIVFSYMFGARNIYAQAVMTAVLALIIALTVFSIVEFDLPLSGQSALAPDAFVALKMD